MGDLLMLYTGSIVFLWVLSNLISHTTSAPFVRLQTFYIPLFPGHKVSSDDGLSMVSDVRTLGTIPEDPTLS
jgi:hypothetical protein